MKIELDIPDQWPVWAKSITVCFTEGDKPYEYNDSSRKEIAFFPRPTLHMVLFDQKEHAIKTLGEMKYPIIGQFMGIDINEFSKDEIIKILSLQNQKGYYRYRTDEELEQIKNR